MHFRDRQHPPRYEGLLEVTVGSAPEEASRAGIYKGRASGGESGRVTATNRTRRGGRHLWRVHIGGSVAERATGSGSIGAVRKSSCRRRGRQDVADFPGAGAKRVYERRFVNVTASVDQAAADVNADPAATE